MSLPWQLKDRQTIEAALERFPARSGRCAALARVIYAVAKPRDPAATGLLIRPRGSARFIQTKQPSVYFWHSHTLVRTHAHHVDALTGADGCEAELYLETHLCYPEALTVQVVDVATIDPGDQHGDQ